MKGKALLMVLGATALDIGSGCDRAEPSPRDSGARGAAVPKGATDEADRAKLRAELRSEVEAELRPRLTQEIRAQLRAEVRAEIEKELSQANGAGKPTAVAATDSPDAGAKPASDASPGTVAESNSPLVGSAGDKAPDPWTTPGAKIWPSPGGLRLVDVEVGTGLEEKVPVDVRLRYERVPELFYCYTVFENPGDEATITHVWRRGTRLVSRVELEVGQSPKWKTWSKQRTQGHWTGTWSCEVLGPDGRQLGLTVFEVGASQPAP